MSTPDTRKALWQIHFCVLLWGITAILGKLITLPALPLVWWRMLLVTAMLALLPRVWRGLRTLPLRLVAGYAGIGALVALHWLTFYGAVKLANASVAATCIALAPVFTSIIEPWVAKRPFQLRELAFGLAVLPGVALVVGGVPDGMRLGVLIGAISALLVAVFGSLNKRMVSHADPLTVTALELGAGTLTLTLLAPLMPYLLPALASPLWVVPDLHDGILLLVLAGFLHAAAVRPGPGRAAPPERLHGAAGDQPGTGLCGGAGGGAAARAARGHPWFYLGVAIIVGAVFLHPLLNRRKPVQHPEILGTAEARNIAD